MQTVFSHIVQKRFSQVSEDVATDALAFIIHSSESARNGMMKLLRGLAPDMPELQFRTQQTEGSIRPDMWGYDKGELRVFVENKFWAGLTDNQPVSYLRQLSEYAHTQSAVLLCQKPANKHCGASSVVDWKMPEFQQLIEKLPLASFTGVDLFVTVNIIICLFFSKWNYILWQFNFFDIRLCQNIPTVIK